MVCAKNYKNGSTGTFVEGMQKKLASFCRTRCII